MTVHIIIQSTHTHSYRLSIRTLTVGVSIHPPTQDVDMCRMYEQITYTLSFSAIMCAYGEWKPTDVGPKVSTIARGCYYSAEASK